MSRQVTITMEDWLDRRVREHQVRVMLERNKSYSFTEAVNDLLAGGGLARLNAT